MIYDAAVVGAGLAGLVAGIRLQHAGLSTVMLEKNARAGGLCATLEDGGLEFAVGCNEFGAGFVRMLAELGVEQTFHRPRARFHFGRRRVGLPPDLRTMGSLALRAPQLARAWWGTRQVETLGQLVDRFLPSPFLADLACLPAFAVMRSPDDVTLASIRADLSEELGYGYDQSSTPAGGPRALIDAMVARYLALGGALRLGEACLRVGPLPEGHELRTSTGTLRARSVLSSEGRWGEYPPEAKPGLEVGLVLLTVRAVRPFPAGLHTLDRFAPGVASMLRQLDAGTPVDEPSWHAICPDLPARDGHYALTVFVPLARAERDPPLARRQALVAHVRRTLDLLLPGLDEAVARASFLSPDAYEERLGQRPRLSPRVAPGLAKPPSLEARSGVHFLGTSVGPPGEHAGAAALSGWRAAQQVLQPHPRGESP